MTNIEKIKSIICSTINSMSEEELFEFLSDYDADEDGYFPNEILFTCKKCRHIYGKCNADVSDSLNYQICQNKFYNFCRAECR